jgi:hypothetical protein
LPRPAPAFAPPKGFTFVHWVYPHGTHQPVLFETAMRCDGTVVELGCGEGSTRLLHDVCAERNLPLLTLEADADWMNRYAPAFASAAHRFELVPDWETALESPRWDEQQWGLVFVDQSPWEARAASVRRLRSNADFVILHDCDYLPAAGLMGQQIRPVQGPSDVGERRYDDVFTSWREYFPLEPWPLFSGPPTLLGSNFHDVSGMDVSYEAYLPSLPRRLLHRTSAAAAKRIGRS